MQLRAGHAGADPLMVSILTRPEGRVQPGHCGRSGGHYPVSILTRPEGRVQQVLDRFFTRNEMFQSSPVPEDGCNPQQLLRTQAAPCRFNPHPSRRTGATSLPPPG